MMPSVNNINIKSVLDKRKPHRYTAHPDTNAESHPVFWDLKCLNS